MGRLTEHLVLIVMALAILAGPTTAATAFLQALGL